MKCNTIHTDVYGHTHALMKHRWVCLCLCVWVTHMIFSTDLGLMKMAMGYSWATCSLLMALPDTSSMQCLPWPEETTLTSQHWTRRCSSGAVFCEYLSPCSHCSEWNFKHVYTWQSHVTSIIHLCVVTAKLDVEKEKTKEACCHSNSSFSTILLALMPRKQMKSRSKMGKD